MTYQHSTHTLTTTADSAPLFWQKWLPKEGTKRTLVFQHGIGEHAGRYQHLLEAFAGTGTAFYAPDARGHGRTEGPRGGVARFSLFASDLSDLIQAARAENQGQPVFLLGHSMGGAVALEYIFEADNQRNVRGLILSSPAIEVYPSTKNKVLKTLANVLVRLAPGLVLDTGLNPARLSQDDDTVAAYSADPLVHGKASVAVGHALYQASQQFYKRAKAIDIPVYLFHGTADRVTSPEGTKAFFDKLTTPDKTLNLYEGLYHETMNELPTERKKVLSDLVAWVVNH